MRFSSLGMMAHGSWLHESWCRVNGARPPREPPGQPPTAISQRLDRILLHDVSRDYDLLDVARAFGDDHQRGIAVVPFERQLLRIRHAAMDAHRVEHDFL